VVVFHDREAEAACIAHRHHHVARAVGDAARHPDRRPAPGEPLLDEIARHACDRQGIGGSGEAEVGVGGHAVPPEGVRWESAYHPGHLVAVVPPSSTAHLRGPRTRAMLDGSTGPRGHVLPRFLPCPPNAGASWRTSTWTLS